MSSNNLPILSVCVAAAAFSTAARADIIYSDFGPTDPTFITYAGQIVSDATTDYGPSFEFTPTSNYVLSDVDFVTSIGSGTDVNQVTVTLSNDNSGVPGSSIVSQEFVGDMGILGSSSAILSWSPDVDLTANTPYWITFDGPVPGDVTWNYNNQGAGGALIFEDGGWTRPAARWER